MRSSRKVQQTEPEEQGELALGTSRFSQFVTSSACLDTVSLKSIKRILGGVYLERASARLLPKKPVITRDWRQQNPVPVRWEVTQFGCILLALSHTPQIILLMWEIFACYFLVTQCICISKIGDAFSAHKQSCSNWGGICTCFPFLKRVYKLNWEVESGFPNNSFQSLMKHQKDPLKQLNGKSFKISLD